MWRRVSTSSRRWLSTANEKPVNPKNAGPVGGGPIEMTVNQLIGTSETVLFYLQNSIFTYRLEAIKKMKATVPTRMRESMQVLSTCQLHTITPFGYSPDEVGYRHWVHDQTVLAGKKDFNKEAHVLQKYNTEIQSVLLRLAFGITKIPELTKPQLHEASAKVAANLQEPGFLDIVSKRYKDVMKPLEDGGKVLEAHDELQSLFMESYIAAIRQLGIERLTADENGYIVLHTIMGQHISDEVISRNMSAGISAIAIRAPLKSFNSTDEDEQYVNQEKKN